MTVIGLTILLFSNPQPQIVPVAKANTPFCVSCSYTGYGTLKSEGKTLYVARMIPAIYQYQGDTTIRFTEDREEAIRAYKHARFFLVAGPVLVRNGKPLPVKDVRKDHPHLDASRHTTRVVMFGLKDGRLGIAKANSDLISLAKRLTNKLNVDWAVNLDGGSGTVWIDEYTRTVGPHARFAVRIETRNKKPP